MKIDIKKFSMDDRFFWLGISHNGISFEKESCNKNELEDFCDGIIDQLLEYSSEDFKLRILKDIAYELNLKMIKDEN